MFRFSKFFQVCKRFFWLFCSWFSFFLAFKLLTSWCLVVGCVYGLILGLGLVWSSRHLHWSQTKQQVVRVVGFWSSLTFVFFCLYFSVILWCSTLDKVFFFFCFWIFDVFRMSRSFFFVFQKSWKTTALNYKISKSSSSTLAFSKSPPKKNNEQENLQYFCLFVTAF